MKACPRLLVPTNLHTAEDVALVKHRKQQQRMISAGFCLVVESHSLQLNRKNYLNNTLYFFSLQRGSLTFLMVFLNKTFTRNYVVMKLKIIPL